MSCKWFICYTQQPFPALASFINLTNLMEQLILITGYSIKLIAAVR
ncbi:hypothetical protein [Bacillus sinesaloumensis]|nr:hypothetical protein [Bacillus sinesaloumensis]